jgi:hypothetical protein
VVLCQPMWVSLGELIFSSCKTYAEMQGCPSAPVARVEQAPCTWSHTEGHTRIIAYVPQGQKNVARGMFVDASDRT